MQENVNYQKVMEEIIEKEVNQNKKPSLLLHACCAPCSSYVLETLTKFFKITILFYNPNIFPIEEFEKRFNELLRLTKEMKEAHDVDVINIGYDNEEFQKISKGLEDIPETRISAPITTTTIPIRIIF